MGWLITVGIAVVSLIVCFFSAKCPHSTARLTKSIWGLASVVSVLIVVLYIQSAGYVLLFGLLVIVAVIIGVIKQKR